MIQTAELKNVGLDCPACDGTGFAHQQCPECQGEVLLADAKADCDTCLGIGGYGSCTRCHGTGRSKLRANEVEMMKTMETALARRLH